jgi:hypothetical protein
MLLRQRPDRVSLLISQVNRTAFVHRNPFFSMPAQHLRISKGAAFILADPDRESVAR